MLLAGAHNIAWLTERPRNRIDASREAGTRAAAGTADGRRFVLANAIEMPRMLAEELAGLDYQPIEYPWIGGPGPGVRRARGASVLGKAAPLGADWPLPDTKASKRALDSRARAC